MPGSTATTETLTTSAPVSGTIDLPADQDWYRFEVAAGRTYVFDHEGVDTAAGTLGNPFLELRDAEGELIGSDTNGVGANDLAGYSASADGTVFVAAGGYFSAGTFRLSAREIVGDVPGNLATSAVIQLGQSKSGVLDFAGDQDWYRVEVVAGKTYAFGLEGFGVGPMLADPSLRLLDEEGNEVGVRLSDGAADLAELGFTAVTDGPVFISAEGRGGNTDDTAGAYRPSQADITAIHDYLLA